MALTPMDIYNKEFSKSFRGYNDDEVDQFLDEIVEDFERLYKENIELKDRLGMLEDQISNYKTMENALKETLVTAQKAASDVSESAQRKSDLIISEASTKANRIIEDANNRVIEIRKEFSDYNKQVQVFKSRFKSLLETQLELLQQEIPYQETLYLEPDEDEIPAEG
ncbi:MAG: DivIVA domain-containing protein [Clostridiales bacterium]|nr:DivIVA domain-containing protein [Clostridiales bacterium]